MLPTNPTNKLRTPHQLLLQHREEDFNRYGAKSRHVEPCSVSISKILLISRLTSTRFTKDEMQRELLENMYRTDTLDDLLKESDYTVRRRKECQQMVESLSRASEIVSQVQ